MALPRRLGCRNVRPGRPEDLPPGGLVLPRCRGGRHVRSADKSHGHRRPLALHPWPMAGLPPQPDRPYPKRGRTVVVARPCHGGRGAGRRLVDDLSRLRKRLSHTGQATPPGADRVDAGWLVLRKRRDAVEANGQTQQGASGTVRLCAIGRFLDESIRCAMEFLQSRPGRDETRPLRGPRFGD